MAAIDARPPARRKDTPAATPAFTLPKTDPEVIHELVKIGFSTSEISSARELRAYVLTAVHELNRLDRERAAASRAASALEAALPVAISKAVVQAATIAKQIYAPPGTV
jgi:hypothetical protein